MTSIIFTAPETTSHRLNVRRALLDTLGTHASNNNLATAMRVAWVGASGEIYERTLLAQGRVKNRLVSNRETTEVHGVNITELVYGAPKKPAGKPRTNPEHLYTAFDLNVETKADHGRIELEVERLYGIALPNIKGHWREVGSSVEEAIRAELKKKYRKGNYRAVDLRTLLWARAGEERIDFNAVDASNPALVHFKIYEDRVDWAIRPGATEGAIEDLIDRKGSEPITEKSRTSGRAMKWSGRAKQAREAILAANGITIFKARYDEYHNE